MVVGEVPTGVDVLVIGGGPGGYTAALAAAGEGRTVTLVEQGRLGGASLNSGGFASKAFVHAAGLAAVPAAAGVFGIRLGPPTVDLAALQARIGQSLADLRTGVAARLNAAGVEVVTGTARFATPHRVAVWRGDDARFYEPSATIVATGSHPATLPALPVDGARVLDASGALNLTEVPSTMVVVGAGCIGVELATAWARLGVAVTIVEAAERILPDLPASLARVVADGLSRMGVAVLTGAAVAGLVGPDVVVEASVDTQRRPPGNAPAGGGPGNASAGGGQATRRPPGNAPAGGGQAGAPPAPRSSIPSPRPGVAARRSIPADIVVVATGRRPNTAGLGLERTGARLDPDGLVTVGPSRAAARGVYAIGDITPGPNLAHKATAEAAVAGAAATGRRAGFDPAAVPVVVYSDPEVASVGLTAEAARGAGADPVTRTAALSANGRAALLGRPEGFVEVVSDRGDGTVLGVHMAGPGAAELAFAAALAVEMGATADDLALTIAPHPTLAEAMRAAADPT